MSLLGTAALAMWWEVDVASRDEFEHWHSHEHFPERLRIAGFCRATRWRQIDGGPGVMVTYELADHAVLSSPAYLDRLNAPTPWSTRMMPLHRHMVRSQCEVMQTRGAYVASCVLAVRLSPRTSQSAERLMDALRTLTATLPQRPGLSGAHLLRHQAPSIAPTTEQKIRGGDRVADWVFLVSGYDRVELRRLAEGELSPTALVALGAHDFFHGLYELAISAVPTDLQDIGGVEDSSPA